MIDEAKTISFSTKPGIKDPFTWDALPIDLLLKYRDEINTRLPPTELSKMNMEEEMLLQYHTIRTLQSEVLNDDSIPPNQRAQVANAVTSSLNKLSELQEQLYTTERYKAVENLLIKCLGKLPEAVAMEFLDGYEKILEKHAGGFA